MGDTTLVDKKPKKKVTKKTKVKQYFKVED